MTRVLALIGSGRSGGNTELLADAILQGAASAGLETEKLSLNEWRITPMQDCDLCVARGGCDIDDAYGYVSTRMLAADVVIFASPMYWYYVSAQMKAFLDRWQCSRRLAPDGTSASFRAMLKGKRALLAVAHGVQTKYVTAFYEGGMRWTFEYFGFTCLGMMAVPAARKGTLEPAALERAFELGATLR